jgi:hypothetical protein
MHHGWKHIKHAEKRSLDLVGKLTDIKHHCNNEDGSGNSGCKHFSRGPGLAHCDKTNFYSNISTLRCDRLNPTRWVSIRR